MGFFPFLSLVCVGQQCRRPENKVNSQTPQITSVFVDECLQTEILLELAPHGNFDPHLMDGLPRRRHNTHAWQDTIPGCPKTTSDIIHFFVKGNPVQAEACPMYPEMGCLCRATRTHKRVSCCQVLSGIPCMMQRQGGLGSPVSRSRIEPVSVARWQTPRIRTHHVAREGFPQQAK